MKLCLAIDTSLYGTSLALFDLAQKNTVLWQGVHAAKGAADAALARLLEEGLTHSNYTLSDINFIVVAQGPGSFTGIKVGLAWAYAFVRGRNSACRIL